MKLFLTILALSLTTASALRCYTCTIGQDDIDQRCVTDPASVESGSAITNCNKQYCTSMRMEYLDPKNKVSSMYRSCEDNPNNKNVVVEDGTYRIYYKACQEDLCNGGTGKEIGGGNGILGDGAGYGTFKVKGIGSGALQLKNSVLLITTVILGITFYNL